MRPHVLTRREYYDGQHQHGEELEEKRQVIQDHHWDSVPSKTQPKVQCHRYTAGTRQRPDQNRRHQREHHSQEREPPQPTSPHFVATQDHVKNKDQKRNDGQDNFWQQQYQKVILRQGKTSTTAGRSRAP